MRSLCQREESGVGGGAHLPHLSLGWSVSEQQGTHSEDARGGDKLGGWH